MSSLCGIFSRRSFAVFLRLTLGFLLCYSCGPYARFFSSGFLVPFVVPVYGFTGIVPEALLPTGTALIFDHREPPLQQLSIDTTEDLPWMKYAGVDVKHFRRVPVSLKLPAAALMALRDEIRRYGMDHAQISLEVEIRFAQPETVDDRPILLLKKKTFGGSHEIKHDSSNFCDWIHSSKDRTENSKVSIAVENVVAGSKYPGFLSRGGQLSGIQEEYMLYVGFAGQRTHPRRLSFALAAQVKLDLPKDDNVLPVCTVFEKFSVAPHHPHMQRRVHIPGLEVIAGEIVMRKWPLVPTYSETMQPVDAVSAQRRAGASFNTFLRSHQLLALGIEVPAAPRADPTWRPHLIVQGPGIGELDVLVGAYHARSIWELHRFEEMADNKSESLSSTRIWALPLGGVITHLQNHRNSWLSPPGTTLIVVIMPRRAQEVNCNLEITLAMLPGSELKLLTDTDASQPFGMVQAVNAYATTVRTLVYGLLGIAAAFGILKAFWLVLTEVSIMSETAHTYFPAWVHRGVQKFVENEGVNPDIVRKSARTVTRLMEVEMEAADLERQRLLDKAPTPSFQRLPVLNTLPIPEDTKHDNPLRFEIGSIPTDSCRSTGALSPDRPSPSAHGSKKGSMSSPSPSRL